MTYRLSRKDVAETVERIATAIHKPLVLERANTGTPLYRIME